MIFDFDCAFVKMSPEAKEPELFEDKDDFGISKIQVFASRDYVLSADQSRLTLSTGVMLKCEIRKQQDLKMNGVVEMFLSPNVNTIGFAPEDDQTFRTVLLTPTIHSLSIEIEFPVVVRNTQSITIKRHASLGFLQFIFRGFSPKSTTSLFRFDPPICNFCQRNNSSRNSKRTNLKKHDASYQARAPND